MAEQELIPHLFRTTFGKICAVLVRQFGIGHLSIAGDIASETFLAALETWPYKVIPENPEAWLYIVAKNKTRNYLRRNQHFRWEIAGRLGWVDPQSGEYDPQSGEYDPQSAEFDPDPDLSDQHISDSQLQMLFVVCHPAISPESQISLALRILCGFGINEIATAFLTSADSIEKRLYRAKEKLRREKIGAGALTAAEMEGRLEAVLTTLYLLFSEGYYSESREEILREELCLEAMRLTRLLLENEGTRLPKVNALFALMCFHHSRFQARKDSNGEMVLYWQQDQDLWNRELIANGAYYLNQAAIGNEVTKYHLEAAIAYWHTTRTDTVEKWDNILQLYDRLLLTDPSPMAELNRIYALSKIHGRLEAIRKAEELALTHNRFYQVLLGELYEGIDVAKSRACYLQAITLTRTEADRRAIRRKLERLDAAQH